MKPYVPKVTLYPSLKTYVFLGNLDTKVIPRIISNNLSSEDEDALASLLGKKYKSTLRLGEPNTTYIKDTFQSDDTVYLVRKKICHFLNIDNENQTYMWYEKSIKNAPQHIYYFIQQCFRKKSVLPTDMFVKYVHNVFHHKVNVEMGTHISKQDALKYLLSQKLNKMHMPLGFKYTYDDFTEFIPTIPLGTTQHHDMTSGLSLSNNFTKILDSFNIHKDTICVITQADVDASLHEVYFPYSATKVTDDAAYIENVLKLENTIRTTKLKEDGEMATIINYVHIKGNESYINAKVNLEVLFNDFVTSEQIPFVKLKTPSNVFYKVHKMSLSTIPKDDLLKWTRIGKTKDDKTFIVFRIKVSPLVYASLSLYADLTYNLKVSSPLKEQHTDVTITRFLPEVNTLLQYACALYDGAFIPLIPKDVLYASQETNIVRVVQIIASSTLHLKTIKFKYENVMHVLKSVMGLYFTVLESKDTGVIHVQYKRTNNFTLNSNILQYIQSHIQLSREDLVKQLMHTFTLTQRDAEKEIESFTSEYDKENRYYAYVRYDSFVNVKIRQHGHVDIKYLTNGLPNTCILEKIHELLLKVFTLSANEKKAAKIPSSEVAIHMLEQQEVHHELHTSRESSPQAPSATKTNAIIDELEGDADGDMGEDDAEVLDEDLLALQEEFYAEAQELAQRPPSPPMQKKDKVQEPETSHAHATPPNTKNEKTTIKGYILNKLKAADPALFDYKSQHADKKRKDYASICGWVDRRQPVVINKQELDTISKEFPDALKGHVQTGSTEEMEENNYYVCPKIWCPKSRVALSYEDYEKYGKKCPYPEIEEEPILFASKGYFGEGENGLKKDRFPSFLDKYTHPDQFCLPCCFKVSAKEGNRNKQRQSLCVSKFKKESAQKRQDTNADASDNVSQKGKVDVTVGATDEDDLIGNEKYIKGEHYSPLENNRFGLLPLQLVEFLNQQGKQGSYQDGTRSMTANTDALLRKGILQSDESFLDACVHVLNNPSIKTTKDLLQVIRDNLDILTYLSLEGGRIMKMFIDTSKPIFHKDNFQAFYEWFKNQKKYIIHMHLDRILREIEAHDVISFDVDKLYHHQDILREYIIYSSYQNFLQYLQNPRIKKEHTILLDLISNKLQTTINIHKYNFMILDYDYDNDKIYINCNINREIEYDANYPFVILFKRNTYYEPIYHVTNKHNMLEQTHLLYMKSTTPEIKKMLSFFTKNCVKRNVSYIHEISQHLTNMGYAPKYYVIDYGYKTCGIIANKNVYIPLPVRFDMYYETNIKYVYISNVPDFKCFVPKETLFDVFSKLRKHTKNDFYKVHNAIFDKGKMIGILINNGDTFIPVNVSAEYQKLRMTFKNGLYILTNYEDADARVQRTQAFFKKSKALAKVVKAIKKRLEQNEDMQKEVAFVIDKKNPLPLIYKKQRLHEIVSKALKDDMDVNMDVNMYDIYNYLQGDTKYHLYTLRTKRFDHTENELVFNYSEIQSGKLESAIAFAENPYKALMHVIDSQESQYVFEEDSSDSFADIIHEDAVFVDVPVKWRKILVGFKTMNVKDSVYNNTYIYNVLQRISNETKGILKDDVYYSALRNHIVKDYEKGNLSELLDNPWLAAHFKKQAIIEPTLDEILETCDSAFYYPSTYDVKLMARLARINLVMIGRVTRKNPDGLEFIYNNSDYYVVLLYSYDRINVIDTFELFVNQAKTFIFRHQDLPMGFIDIINKKMKVYEVNVEDDE